MADLSDESNHELKRLRRHESNAARPDPVVPGAAQGRVDPQGPRPRHPPPMGPPARRRRGAGPPGPSRPRWRRPRTRRSTWSPTRSPRRARSWTWRRCCPAAGSRASGRPRPGASPAAGSWNGSGPDPRDRSEPPGGPPRRGPGPRTYLGCERRKMAKLRKISGWCGGSVLGFGPPFGPIPGGSGRRSGRRWGRSRFDGRTKPTGARRAGSGGDASVAGSSWAASASFLPKERGGQQAAIEPRCFGCQAPHPSRLPGGRGRTQRALGIRGQTLLGPSAPRGVPGRGRPRPSALRWTFWGGQPGRPGGSGRRSVDDAMFARSVHGRPGLVDGPGFGVRPSRSGAAAGPRPGGAGGQRTLFLIANEVPGEDPEGWFTYRASRGERRADDFPVPAGPEPGRPTPPRAELVRRAIADGASAILVTPKGDAQLPKALAEAEAKGIPVVLIGRPVTPPAGSKPFTTVAPGPLREIDRTSRSSRPPWRTPRRRAGPATGRHDHQPTSKGRRSWAEPGRRP